MTIVIVDYGIGNIMSIQNAFSRLGLSSPELSRRPEVLRSASGLILPGVGAFSACMNNLIKYELVNLLNELVFEQRKPILGICVGMQLMANFSTEGGKHKGLGWIPAEVIRIKHNIEFQVPHVGWNDVNIIQNNVLFENITDKSHFYFDHSYHFVCDKFYVTATVDYGLLLNVTVQNGNIFGVQFHPEKSANSGLRLFRSFTKYVQKC